MHIFKDVPVWGGGWGWGGMQVKRTEGGTPQHTPIGMAKPTVLAAASANRLRDRAECLLTAAGNAQCAAF